MGTTLVALDQEVLGQAMEPWAFQAKPESLVI